MKKTTTILTIVLGVGVAGPAWLIASSQYGDDGSNPAAATDAQAADIQQSRTDAPSGGVEELLYARRFRLDRPYRSRWTKERTDIDRGYLVVIRVQPEYLYPHEAATPVLYAGDRPIERINVGYQDGVIVGIILGDAQPESTPIYFGSPDYPERVSAAKGVLELQGAQVRGVVARPAVEVERALSGHLDPFVSAGVSGLYREAGRLIAEFAPSEAVLADELQAAP
ncbi:MAG: hypothetical protein H6819_05565 [Phycisphaerales bacterium]|nr:hypothetical protein [Phycisphaerales bacterium]MCB9854752.1 hypothetical protein [Phycisphaerales bacterium]MCB9863776.1 hypothetical protein [Phycisphaerales bacterium]